MQSILNKIPLSGFRSIFSIDLRSLALFRVSLAIMLLVNLAFRSTEIFDFYSEDGVLTRSQSIGHAHALRFSLYWIHSSEWFAGTLMAISAFAAILLLLGYRSRWMALLSWVLLLSLLNRNQFVHQAGDYLLAMMLFWSMFLPIGARFSIDNALDRRYVDDLNPAPRPTTDSNRFFSIATVGVILQVISVYLFTAFQKTGAPWRETMDAAYLAVQLDHIATPLGYFMRDYPALLTIGTYFVLYVEYAVIFLVLSPIFNVQLRFLTLLLLLFMHAVFFLSLNIGLFPFIDYMSLTVLIPAAMWNWFESRKAGTAESVSGTQALNGIRVYYDADCGFCRKTCLILREFLLPSSVPILKAQSDPDIYRIMQAENSWVVTDRSSQPHIHWHAMVYLFRQRLLMRPVAWLMNLPGVINLGNALYRFVAIRRDLFSRFTSRFLGYTSIMRRPGWLNQTLAALAIYIMIYGNLKSIDLDYTQMLYRFDHYAVTEPLDKVHNALVKTFRLEQNWNMFSPKPPTYSFMPVITGTLVDDTKVDVYNHRMSEPDWVAPERMVDAYKSYRWRKYFENVRGHSSNVIRRAYGGHLCRQWNTSSTPHDKKLGIMEIWFLSKKTLPDNQTKPEKRDRKWIHWCLPEFAPDKKTPPS